MHELLRWAARCLDSLNRGLAALGCLLMVLITVAICLEILTRWMFDITNIWLVELSEIMLLYIVFLGAAWVLGKDAHVSLDVFLIRLSTKNQRRLHVALSILGATACFVLVWFGVDVMIDQFRNDIREPTIMAPKTFWITAVIPFGFLLLGVQFLRRSVRAATGIPLAVDAG
jgi:C4-dicarboxylate transporter DctQ subunit